MNKRSFSVRTYGDKETCVIDGMCQMPGGNIIVADFGNFKLKQLNESYEVIFECLLNSGPLCVCRIEADMVAVGLLDKSIQFVFVGEEIIMRNSISTEHSCNSIAYSKNSLYITEYFGSKVYVYNLSGTLLRTINKDQCEVFSIRHIATSPDGEHLYITSNRGVTALDIQGNILDKFNSPELLDGPYALCVCGNGDFAVGGFGSKNVVLIEQERYGKVTEILSSSEGIHVYGLCFDDVNSRLLVSSYGSDIVHALKFSK